MIQIFIEHKTLAVLRHNLNEVTFLEDGENWAVAKSGTAINISWVKDLEHCIKIFNWEK